MAIGGILLLTGCAQAQIAKQCKDENPMPYGEARIFGPFGDLIAAGTPEMQEWDRKFAACKAAHG